MICKFSIPNGAKYFSLGIFLNYLVFIPAIKHIKYFHGNTQIYFWKSTGVSKKSIKKMTKSDSNFAPTFADHHILQNCITDHHFADHQYFYLQMKVMEKMLLFLELI